MFLEYLNGDKRWLLENIDQFKVWSNILGYSPKLGQKILNPLRGDKHMGSCYLISDKNVLLIDHADTKTNGYDCVEAYKCLHPYKKWEEICSDLLNMAQILPSSSYRVVPGLPKKEQTIQPIYREWEDEDIKWFENQGVFKWQLDRQETLVKPAKGYIQTKDTKKSEKHFNERCYCYHHNNKIKLYWPDRKQWRFLGTMGRDDLWMIRGEDSTGLIITKSHKDSLALESCLPFSITHTQSETSIPSGNILLDWEMGFDNIWILFDNDDKGIEGANNLAKQFIYKKPKLLFLEDYKDPTAMIKGEGLRETTDYLLNIL